VVSFAIHVGKLDLAGPMIEMVVGVGGRVYEVHSKDLGFKSATLRTMTIH
jgi:hypothetical protein